MKQHPDNVQLNVTMDEQAQSLLTDAGNTLAEIPANAPEPQQQLDMGKVLQFSRIEQQPEPDASPSTSNEGPGHDAGAQIVARLLAGRQQHRRNLT